MNCLTHRLYIDRTKRNGAPEETFKQFNKGYAAEKVFEPLVYVVISHHLQGPSLLKTFQNIVFRYSTLME